MFTKDFSDDRVVYEFFFKINYLIFACVGSLLLQGFFVFSLVAVSRGYSLVAVLGLLIAVAFLVAEHRLYGTWAQ